MKKLIVLLFIFFSGIVFSQKSTITGKITGFKDGTIVELDSDLGEIMYRTKIKNNKFIFKNPSKSSINRFYINIKEDSTWKGVTFFAENKNIILSGDKSEMPHNIKITGSKSNDEKITFEKSYKLLESKKDSINDLVEEKLKDTIKYSKEEINNDRLNRTKLKEKIESIKIENIKSNPNRYIALMELFWLKDKIGKEEVRKLYNQLDEKLKQTEYGKNLKIHLDLEKVLKEGDCFEDFQAKDINGVTRKISDYKGKYILLDFIQTYCYGCVLSNDDLKKINVKFNNELQIVTFCGDKSEKTWREGYKEHQIKWVSLWNGGGLSDRINQLYGTEGTPTFILINPDGKIIKKHLGYDEGYLETLLNQEINKINFVH